MSTINVLLVGGGASGAGGFTGTGGGGGQVNPDTAHAITPGTYPVVIGAGGVGVGNSILGNNGGTSTFDSMTAIGGYGGGFPNGGPSGGNSGDGGTPSTSINGGNGYLSSISGSPIYYGAGGGAADNSANNFGQGGATGGGQGGGNNFNAGGGQDGLGAAGGGANANHPPSGTGGKGACIMSYPTGNIQATGGTITTAGGNTIHTFTANGDFVVTNIGPVVTTEAVSSIDILSAIGNGTVVSDAGSTVTQRGVVWGTSPNPTVADNRMNVSGTTGSYAVSMTGLSPGTLYYVRAYAVNANDTSYGSQVTFTTLSAAPTQLIKDIEGISGQAYAVSIDVGGSIGSVTVKMGTTGTSQVILAGAGTVIVEGTYDGLSGIIFDMSSDFNGWIDNFYYVLVTGDAVINWMLGTVVNLFAIDSSVLFKRIEAKEFNTFRFFRYLDLLFKNLNARVTVTINQEQSNNLRTKTTTFLVDNPAVLASPFIKKKVSFLSKNQAILIGLSNNNLNDTFTICKFDLKGYEENKGLFQGSSIISVE